jgi:DNA polymerase-3 subunit chi
MPRIDFYILDQAEEKSRLNLACRLIEKAYKNRHRIYVHTEDANKAHALDELLWTYREDSFLPHNLHGDGPEPPPPIQIGFATTPEKQRDILINLSKTVPPFYTQFARILEIVCNHPEIQADTREHYRYYRSQGHDINTHKLQSVE